MAISMLKIRRPLGRLIFNMGIAIPGKTVFLIETAPSFWYNSPDIMFMMTSSNGNIYRVTGPLWGGVHRSAVVSPHKGQWRGALMFSLIWAWTNGWTNNRDAGDLRRSEYQLAPLVLKPEYSGITRSMPCLPSATKVMISRVIGSMSFSRKDFSRRYNFDFEKW